MIPRECILNPNDIVRGRPITGSTINYKVVRKLGEGGFGVVYLVNSNTDNTQYALKVLKLWALNRKEQDNYRKRFDRACQVMHTPCKYLVHSVDNGEIAGNPFYVMEFCPKGDLLDHFENFGQANREQEVVRCMYQVLLGLKELHGKGMVHRDIKPENVMLRSDGTIVLNDFDLAGDENNRFTTQYNLLGIPKQSFYTKAFAPPEQVNPIRGKKEVMVMPTIDIFAFGVMTYQLLIGTFPFGNIRTESDMAVYYAHANNDEWDRSALKRTSNAQFWLNLLEPCLKGNYQKRISDVQCLIDRFKTQFPSICRENIIYTPRQHTDEYALEIVYGESAGSIFRLNAGKGLILMGRDTDNVHNDVSLYDETNHYVSRRHATLEWDSVRKHWFIRDGQFDYGNREWKRSKNGTYVNSHEIDDQDGVCLNLDDMIYVGDMRLKVIDAKGIGR